MPAIVNKLLLCWRRSTKGYCASGTGRVVGVVMLLTKTNLMYNLCKEKRAVIPSAQQLEALLIEEVTVCVLNSFYGLGAALRT